MVRKEMYDFVDKGERHVALRPEITASVVRAFIQHHPTTPWKSWYAASNFRFERPKPAATGSSTRSESRRSAARTPIWTSR